MATFAQGLAQERQATLLQIADATVDELRAAAGRGLCKIGLLDQHRAVAARRRFNRRGQTTRAAADHQHVPDDRLILQPLQHFSTVHYFGNDCSMPCPAKIA
jgi:hypothetical protein